MVYWEEPLESGDQERISSLLVQCDLFRLNVPETYFPHIEMRLIAVPFKAVIIYLDEHWFTLGLRSTPVSSNALL